MTKLGNGLTAKRDRNHVTLYKFGSLLKRVDISKAINRRLLIVELVNDLGARPSKVAEALKISRQTVYNNLDTYKYYGADGLLHSQMRGVGNKARMHEQRRQLSRAALRRRENKQTVLQFTDTKSQRILINPTTGRNRAMPGGLFSAPF